MLETHVRVLYEYLGHHMRGFVSRVHCQEMTTNKCLFDGLVGNEDDLMFFINKYEGKGNLFISRNPMTYDEDVAHIFTVSFDIDPIGYDELVGATDEQINACIRAGEVILNAYPGGSLACSGNGVLVLYRGMASIEGFAEKFSVFNESVISPLISGIKDVKLDNLFDNKRLIKIIGSTSCRGVKRHSRFIVWPKAGQTNTIFDAIQKMTVKKEDLIESQTSEDKIKHPARRAYLLSIAGSLRRKNVPLNGIYEAVKSAYETNCEQSPPKDDKALWDIAQGVMKYEHKMGDGLGQDTNSLAGVPLASSTVRISSNVLDDYNAFLQTRKNFVKPELSTGYSELDKLTFGYQRQNIFTLGAYTGQGKSTWLINSADALCRDGKKVLYLSTELSKWQIFDKLFSLNTGIEYFRFLKGDFTEEEQEKLNGFRESFVGYPLLINDSLGLTSLAVEDWIKEEKPDVLMVDHIHEIGAGNENVRHIIGEFLAMLQRASRQHNVAVVISGQFNRPQKSIDKETGKSYTIKAPTIYDFKECAAIENKSRTVMLMYDSGEAMDEGVNLTNFEVAKCTFGQRGLIKMKWAWKLNQFKELICA